MIYQRVIFMDASADILQGIYKEKESVIEMENGYSYDVADVLILQRLERLVII